MIPIAVVHWIMVMGIGHSLNPSTGLIVHKMAGSLLLCYVDHHNNKAYDWAERRKLETHPKTGAAQLVEIRERVEAITAPKYIEVRHPAPAKPLLFAHLSDDDLLSYGVPRAVISLKQGAGQLIRDESDRGVLMICDESDRGVLMICDPCLLSRPYGRRIWQSLPPMKRTREVAEVEAFFASSRTVSGGTIHQAAATPPSSDPAPSHS